MKLRRVIYVTLSALMAATAVSVPTPTAEATTTQATKKKSKKSKASSKKSSTSKSGTSRKKSRKGSKKGKSRGKKTTKRRTTTRKSIPAPKPETPSYDSLTLRVNEAVIKAIPADKNPGGLRVNSVKPDKYSHTAKLSLNENFTYLPVTQELISHLGRTAREALPDSLSDYKVSLSVGTRPLAYFINKIDKLPEQYRQNIPFVYPAEPYVNAKKGMEGDIVALWHSHGRYFKNGCWQWQRPLLYQTVEDMFPMTYILPYAVPMLENAGAYVLLPRERDINPHEVIVDNDINPEGEIYSQPFYKEMSAAKKWSTGSEEGFIYDLPDFRDTENPFENGTYRQTTTVKGGTPSVAAWYADIPEDGEYAVYVSYKSLPESTEDAHYTVNYSGGSREFRVNQKMGGGTWIYLGTFPFEAGYSDTEPVVTLSNLSGKHADRIVTADAIKIGGGMGNIARSPRRADIYYDPSTPDNSDALTAQTVIPDDEEEEDEDDEEGAKSEFDIEGDGEPEEKSTAVPATPVQKGPAPTFRTSGLPRFLEGARYWMQWAGAPENVYSPYHGSDDYKDDYTSRGLWVNWLAGGSRVLPDRDGLGIPVDVTMALHTDAGKRADDSTVGTLGIYYTNNGDSYADGTPRINSRMLTDLLMRQITGDIRQTYESGWTRRQMWDKSYVEARVPEVPTALIELMSHQNFGDMQYGLDPGFQFVVGRAIYKALGRFVSERKGRDFIVQPLPVSDFAITRKSGRHYRLSWQPTPDPLEPTATPKEYIIFERVEGELGFHKIGSTRSTHFDVTVNDNLIHSFRIAAANEGGLSFDSETLALREAPKGAGQPMLIVNGFTRTSAPGVISDSGRAGFDAVNDFGVPYIRDISFAGYQTNFQRNAGNSSGSSGSTHVSTIVGGNTFDYPALHGEAIAAAGFGFVSASAGAVENGDVKLSDYKTVDLILGKQKTTVTGNGKSGRRYQAFPQPLRDALEKFSASGGKLIVSGQYVSSDLFDSRSGSDSRTFAHDVLGLAENPDSLSLTRSGRVSATGPLTPATYTYSTTLRPDYYVVEHPDILTPDAGAGATTLLTFSDTGLPAGFIATPAAAGKGGKTAVLSIPIEAITDPEMRMLLMSQILEALK